MQHWTSGFHKRWALIVRWKDFRQKINLQVFWILENLGSCFIETYNLTFKNNAWSIKCNITEVSSWRGGSCPLSGRGTCRQFTLHFTHLKSRTRYFITSPMLQICQIQHCSRVLWLRLVVIFDVITSIKSMESMKCMYEKVSRYFTACPVTLLRFALPYVTFCGFLRNIM